MKIGKNNNKRLKPFLKWPGGKRWLVTYHPDVFELPFKRYIEPFLGSGAVFFHLQPEKAILSDVNDELINTYKAIKDDYKSVERFLRFHQKYHTKEHYYEVRRSCPRNLFKKAARIIYLNRTCWNGLYRVNKKGKFNVPIGTKNKVLLDEDDFKSVSALLDSCIVEVSDFEKTINIAEDGDLVFVDPPYTVIHTNNGFMRYNEKLFSWDDQQRLSKCLLQAKERGARIVATNANHSSVINLYKKYFDLFIVERASIISGKASSRRPCEELLIVG